jgi:hypothetical protein
MPSEAISYGAPAKATLLELPWEGPAPVVGEHVVTTPEGAPLGPARGAACGAEVWFFDGRRVLGVAEW